MMKIFMGPSGKISIKGLETREKHEVYRFFTWLTTAGLSPLTNIDSTGV